MHQFVDSPNGTKYAFRYFTGDDQPHGAKGEGAVASPCEVWICNSDLAGHHRAFASPKSEGGHGSDVIVWVTDDLIYYAGLAYQSSTGKVLWQFDGTDAELPLARMSAVNPNKLYVAIRGNGEPTFGASDLHESVDSRSKGYYWIDPSSPTKPELHLVTDMRDLVQHYKGSWESAEATYIYQNPSDTKVFVVIYDRDRREEYAFVLNADGTIHSFLGHSREGYCANGHVLWYGDSTLLAGNQHPGLFDLEGRLLRRLADRGRGNHVSISPDSKWWVGDLHRDQVVRLNKFGSSEYAVISGDVKYDECHPSFSRDGRYVFFQGRRSSEPHMGVFRVDVSGITGVENEE